MIIWLFSCIIPAMIEANSTYKFFDMSRTTRKSEKERIVENLAKKVRRVTRKLPDETPVESLRSWRGPSAIPEWQNLMRGLSWGERSVFFRTLSPILSYLSVAHDFESAEVTIAEIREAKSYLGDGYINGLGPGRIKFINQAF